MNSGAVLNMEQSIHKIICRFLTDNQIEANFQKAYKKHLPNDVYNSNLMELVVHECREMALKQIPKQVFNTGQQSYIRLAWKIDL